MKIVLRAIGFLAILSMIGAAAGCSQTSDGGAPLSGQIQSPQGEPLAGIPVRANLQNSNIAVTVFTNKEGHYSYRELMTGGYTVSIKLAGFEPVQREGVNVTPEDPAQLDFTLQSREPSLEELTSAEILLALPGTDKLKVEAADCSDCHPMQFALRQRRNRDEWLQIIEKMRGITSSGVMRPAWAIRETLEQTHDINQELADFYASVRGPDSPELPYKLFPRPTEEASTNAVITEYRIPRGAVSVTFRGDSRGAWLHDVMPDPNGRYVWYTDHFTNVLGRLDPETGEIKEFSYPDAVPEKQQGAHKLLFDKEGSIWLAQNWQGVIVRFDPRTEEFEQWVNRDEGARHGMFGIASDGNIWTTSSATHDVYHLDITTGEFTRYPIPTRRGTYGSDVDSNDLFYYCQFRGGQVAKFDPKTEKFTEWPTPTPDAGPRRLDIDDQDRVWFAEFFAGNIAMLDPETETIREWKISDDPYAAPYDVAVDNYNKTVWTNDFNNNRVFRFDMQTEQVTEFLLPEADVEIRHLYVDGSTTPATLWIPDYSPPGKILKLQAW